MAGQVGRAPWYGICTILNILQSFAVLSSTIQRHLAHHRGFIVLSYFIYYATPGGTEVLYSYISLLSRDIVK